MASCFVGRARSEGYLNYAGKRIEACHAAIRWARCYIVKFPVLQAWAISKFHIKMASKLDLD